MRVVEFHFKMPSPSRDGDITRVLKGKNAKT